MDKFEEIKSNKPTPPYVDNEDDLVWLIEEVERLRKTTIGELMKKARDWNDSMLGILRLQDEEMEKLKAERTILRQAAGLDFDPRQTSGDL